MVEGLDSLEAFRDLSGDGDVTEMAKKRMPSRPIVNGPRVILGTTHIKRIQGLLVYEVKDHRKRNLEANYNDWGDVKTMRARGYGS